MNWPISALLVDSLLEFINNWKWMEKKKFLRKNFSENVEKQNFGQWLVILLSRRAP